MLMVDWSKVLCSGEWRQRATARAGTLIYAPGVLFLLPPPLLAFLPSSLPPHKPLQTASGATAIENYIIGLNRTAPFSKYTIQCSTSSYGDCTSTETVTHLNTSNVNPKRIFAWPLLPCGWIAKGITADNARKSISSYGFLSSSNKVWVPTFIPQ